MDVSRGHSISLVKVSHSNFCALYSLQEAITVGISVTSLVMICWVGCIRALILFLRFKINADSARNSSSRWPTEPGTQSDWARNKRGTEPGRENYYPNFLAMLYWLSILLITALIFVETSRGQIQTTVETLSPTDVPDKVIQNAGQDLGTLLGRVLEVKLRVRRLIDRLEE